MQVVGIDLGTTYSVVAISQKGNVTAIADSDGYTLVPSTVAFLSNGGLLLTYIVIFVLCFSLIISDL